jgi:phosphoglycolate phosphatase
MNYTTVLWDLDGTILDSGPGIFESFRKTFEAMGLPQISDEQMRTFLGPPLRVTFSEHLGLSPQDTERALELYKGFYLPAGAANASLYPGVIEAIQSMRSAGIATSLATSKAIGGVLVVGEHFDFLHLFDFLGTASLEANRLSKVDVMTYALDGLKQIGADLSKVLLVGDRIHDVEGARHHGVDVALVKWGYGTPEEWAQADYVLESPAELLKLLNISQEVA